MWGKECPALGATLTCAHTQTHALPPSRVYTLLMTRRHTRSRIDFVKRADGVDTQAEWQKEGKHPYNPSIHSSFHPSISSSSSELYGHNKTSESLQYRIVLKWLSWFRPALMGVHSEAIPLGQFSGLHHDNSRSNRYCSNVMRMKIFHCCFIPFVTPRVTYPLISGPFICGKCPFTPHLYSEWLLPCKS